MMDQARRRVEAAGYQVVAGIMGITNQGWIWRKGAKALDDHQRVDLINLLAREAGCGTWLRGDVRGREYTSNRSMARHLLNFEYPDHSVFGVVGGDFCRGYFPSRQCVCMHRDGYADPAEDAAQEQFVVSNDATSTFSSTRVRKALDAKDEVALIELVGETAAHQLLRLPADDWHASESAKDANMHQPMHANVNRPKAVLVNHGSFNPPHRGHVQMMDQARRRLEAAGYQVVAGIMGITSQKWIWIKGAKALKDQRRVDLINLLAGEAGTSQWLRGDIRGRDYKSYWEMISNLLQGEYQDHKLFGVVGGDWCRGEFPIGPCVCVHRSGHEDPVERTEEDHFIASHDATSTFSSTRVRRSLQDSTLEQLADLVGEAASAKLRSIPPGDWRASPWAEERAS